MDCPPRYAEGPTPRRTLTSMCVMAQEVLPDDVILAVNDVPLFSFPTPTCVQLLDLSSRCERRRLKIFRRGEAPSDLPIDGLGSFQVQGPTDGRLACPQVW
jgi:hypothetical protein